LKDSSYSREDLFVCYLYSDEASNSGHQ
jgi:hypothetical protein